MKITTEDFIKKAKELHPNKNYDYSKSIYIKANKKVEIICPIHGSFFQTPNSHNSSRSAGGCPECRFNKKSNTKEFIEKAKKFHGDKYDYNETIYVTSKDKMKLYCKEHKQFFYQNANNILQGQKCSCGRDERISKSNSKYTKESFIEQSKEKHGNKYDYSLIEFNNIKSIIKIICKKHNYIFEQTADSHLRSIHCCPKCIKEVNKRTTKYTTEEFIIRAKKIHGDKYNYSLVKYVNGNTKVKITCPIHGVFEQLPRSHINVKCGCPFCKSSQGENYIEKILVKNKIKFKRQKTFKNCKLQKLLPFDFYLEDYDVLIEYNGFQHYEFFKFFHKTKKEFLKRIERDQIKWQYAKDNNIKLLEIPYWIDDSKIEKIILKEINES